MKIGATGVIQVSRRLQIDWQTRVDLRTQSKDVEFLTQCTNARIGYARVFMATQKRTASQRKNPKRSFARLGRENALEAAAGAVGLLRKIFNGAPRAAGYALELVETQLNDILLFASSKRLPDEIFCDVEAVAVPTELAQARKSAAGAMKALRKTLEDARADLSVDESQCTGLDDALDLLEQALNVLLPPPGAPRRPKLPFYDDEDEAVPVQTGSVQ